MTVETPTAAAISPERVRSKDRLGSARRWLYGLALPVGLAVLWELAVRAGWSQGRLVPPPSRVFDTFADLWRSGELTRHTVATVLRVAAGFGLGVAFATLLGAIAGYSALARSLLDPSLQALRFVAKRLKLPVRDIAVVGDDPLVEVLMARRGGATALGVLTGMTNREEWAQKPESQRPHHVLGNLRDILNNGVVGQ